jgi:hypothetical protein
MGAAENPGKAPNAVTQVTLSDTPYPDGYPRDINRELWARTYYLPQSAWVRIDVTNAPLPFHYHYPWYAERPDINWQFVGPNAGKWGHIVSELMAGRHPLGPLGRML